MDLLKHLQLEHLEGDQKQLAETVGIEAYRKIVSLYAGSVLYVPTVDRLTKKVRDCLIRDDYNGYNHRALARKYGVSEQWIRTIIGEGLTTNGHISMIDVDKTNF